jgi:hypothetical protein
VASHDGHSVTMLDSHTGRLVQTIALAQDAELTDIALDEQRSRVVVSALYTVASERAGRPGLVTILDARTGAIVQTGAPAKQPGPLCVGVTGLREPSFNPLDLASSSTALRREGMLILRPKSQSSALHQLSADAGGSAVIFLPCPPPQFLDLT